MIWAVQYSVETNSLPPSDDVGFDIWSNDNGPGIVLFGEGTIATAPTQTTFGTTIVTALVFPWAPIILPAGEYWIGLGTAIPGYAGGPGTLLTDDVPYPYSFESTGDSAGFTIFGGPPGVPEPSTWAMVLIGFAGLGYAGYWRGTVKSRSVDGSRTLLCWLSTAS